MLVRPKIAVAAKASLLLALVGITGWAWAGAASCERRANDTVDKLVECVTTTGVRAHQAAFQAAADANGGTRASGTGGFDDSVTYVVGVLEDAGYDVELNGFAFEYSPPGQIQQLTPVSTDYQIGSFTGTGFGDITGNVIPVDLALGNVDWPADPTTANSGCETNDFAGLDFSGPDDIALIQRGACFFSTKATNAEIAGAEAVIVFNQGNASTRRGPISGDASDLPGDSPSEINVPLIGVSFDAGVALSQVGSAARVAINPPVDTTQVNILAELPGKNTDNVVMAGAHLDSVGGSPGVQDNGSGSAAILEAAVQLAKVEPQNTIRFGWWAAEESGLAGSTRYVAGLSQEERDRIALYLNFDMIASPNFVYFIYDGDNSDAIGVGPAPEGSARIEEFFENFYDARGLPYLSTHFSGRSDYGPFNAAGIPAGGLFTGAEVVKTTEQAAIWGGVAGEQYDQCYHLACDTFDNVSLEALAVNSDAVAASVLSFGMNTRIGIKTHGVDRSRTGDEEPGTEDRPSASPRRRPSTT